MTLSKASITLSVSFFIVGLFLSISVIFGVSVNPEDIIADAFGRVFEQLGNPLSTALWSVFTTILLVAGLMSVVSFFLTESKVVIIVASLGFVAGFIIIPFTLFGAILFIADLLIAELV